jgi:hypothetical protein
VTWNLKFSCLSLLSNWNDRDALPYPVNTFLSYAIAAVGFELSLRLARQVYYHLSHTSKPIFATVSLAEIEGMLLCPVYWDEISITLCLDWLQTMILLTSASWIAGITSLSHHSLLYSFFFFGATGVWT